MKVQAMALMLGEGGCYFFVVLKRFLREMDALRYYEIAVEKKWLRADCYIDEPVLLANWLSDKKWRIEKIETDSLPTLSGSQWAAIRYERVTTKAKLSHFCLWYEGRLWDPLGDSQTRTHGKMVSYRLFTEVGQ